MIGVDSKENGVPSKIKQSQFPRTLKKLQHEFDRYPDNVLGYRQHEAMAKGVIKKSGIQVPRFVITRDTHEDARIYLGINALTSRGLPHGDYEGYEYPAYLQFEVSGQLRAIDEPLTESGQIIDNGNGTITVPQLSPEDCCYLQFWRLNLWLSTIRWLDYSSPIFTKRVRRVQNL